MPRLGNDQLRVERVGEPGDDFILHVEKVRHRLVKPVRPKMVAAFGVDELDVDPHSTCGALDASLQHVAHVELAPNLFEIDLLAFVSKGGVSADNQHPAHLREVCGQTFGNAVDEIVLLRVARQIHEWKNHD